MMKYVVLCISFLITRALANSVPFIHPCIATDSECILNSAKLALPHMIAGVKELGLAPLDPLTMPDTINVNAGDLKLTFKDIVIHNLGKCNLNKIERDPVKSTGLLDMKCPIKVLGQYKAGGKLFLLDVEGEGPFEIVGDEVRVIVNIKLKKISKDGVEVYKISAFDFKYEPISKFSFKFHNLFNGVKEKAEPIEKILDESWKELIMDDNVGKPVITMMIKQCVKQIDKLFQSMPANELEIV